MYPSFKLPETDYSLRARLGIFRFQNESPIGPTIPPCIFPPLRLKSDILVESRFPVRPI